MLIVDEGQRRKLIVAEGKQADTSVKSDTNLIFNRLKTLNTVHRILLTGTPLNNNLRELFNLLNFLDPVNFKYVYPRFIDQVTDQTGISQIWKNDFRISTKLSWGNYMT
jgi:SNF2 family DNA or RNA helicase